MSGYTMTQMELLYSSALAGTTTTPATTAAQLFPNTPQCIVPAGYFQGLGTRTGSLKLVVGGLATTTATIPTWKFGLEITSTNAFATTPAAPFFETATFTPPNARTAAVWFMEIEILIRAQGYTNTSTIVCQGRVIAPDLLPVSAPTNGAASIPATNVSNTYTTFDTSLQYWLNPYMTLGTGTAGNTVTAQYMKLYGEN